MKNIAVFASGNGSNFSAIAQAVKKGIIKANLVLLVTDNPDAFVITRAKEAKVQAMIIRAEDFLSKQDFEQALLQRLKAEKIGLIVLAGFMRLLSADFVKKFKNRILNIHPALLPAFKGASAIKDAFQYSVKHTGVTVHFVDSLMDHGAIILQEPVKVEAKDTLASLAKKIHALEHKLYPLAIKLSVENKLRIKGRKVIISIR